MQNWRNFNKKMQEKKAERNPGGGGKFPPWEMEQLTFEPGETFYVRFLPPANGAPFERYYHWPAGGFPHSCTLEHPAFGEKCVYCHITPEDKEERQKFRARRTMRTVLELIDFRFFHITPHPEKDGKETITRCVHDDPDPKRNRCHLCASEDKRVQERHGPAHKVVELTQDQWDQVWGVHQKLQHTCIHVHEDGKVCNSENYPVAYLCEHCEEVLIDEDELRKMPPKQLAQVVASAQTCPHCSEHDFLWGIFACDGGGRSMTPAEQKRYDEMPPEERAAFRPEDADHWVVRGSMFDKVLEVTITGKEKNIGGKMVTLKGFNFSTGPEWSRLEDDLAQFNLEDAAIEKLCEPWDLDERYRPEKSVKPDEQPSEEAWVEAVLDAQAESAGVKNPWGGSGSKNPWGKTSEGGAKRSFRSS